jgi:hypothetical protein
MDFLNSITYAGASEKTVQIETLYSKVENSAGGRMAGNAKKQWTMEVNACFDLWGVIGQSDASGSSTNPICSNLQVGPSQ